MLIHHLHSKIGILDKFSKTMDNIIHWNDNFILCHELIQTFLVSRPTMGRDGSHFVFVTRNDNIQRVSIIVNNLDVRGMSNPIQSFLCLGMIEGICKGFPFDSMDFGSILYFLSEISVLSCTEHALHPAFPMFQWI